MLIVHLLALASGLAITVTTLNNVLQTVVVPRATASRLSGPVLRVVQGLISRLAQTRSDYLDRDAILAQGAPLVLVLRLVAWIGLLVTGFTLLFWGSGAGDLAGALRLSASSILPLGLTHAGSGLATAIAFLETASGVIVVALQISYLPTLYGTFNRRETMVTLLESSSGSPPWGPEVLSRHALIDNEDHLADLYHDWEQWAADLAESHTSYASLLYFRSPEPRTSWILALLACLDAAAIHLALNPLTAPPAARPFLRMGIVSLRSIARVTRVPYTVDPMPDDPIQLTFEEFREAVERMEAAGWVPERGVEEAWPHFRGWRVNYEAAAYGLARLVDAPPSPWSGTRYGKLASSMVPVRPPHRAPSPERDRLLKVTRSRRAFRAAGRPEAEGRKHRPRHEPSPTSGPSEAGKIDEDVRPEAPPDAK